MSEITENSLNGVERVKDLFNKILWGKIFDHVHLVVF